MSEDPIHSLCERFYVRLRDCRSTNVQNYAFFPNGTAKNVFHTNQAELRELLGYTCQRFGISTSTPVTSEADLARRVLADFNNILAAIIWARLPSAEEFLRDFLHLFPEIIGSIARPLITDDDLPISLPLARRVFPTNAQDFYDEQFRFCAVTLMKREEVIYKGERCLCPLPYLEESEIAEGSFGRVFRVRIEGQHVVSRGSQSINQKPRYCARKDFPVNRERAFQWEQEILKRIHRQPRSNENVMVAIASLQYGDTYSLFFELATCNLWDYLYGKYDSTRPVPSGVETRSDIYRRGVALAGALAFLHHEFRDQKLDNLSCYHLDLKPHNVLVFNAYTPAEIWKITDFGVSRVKGRSDDGEEVQMLTPFLRKTRRVKAPREELTRNPRGEGTYLAPECAQRYGKVGSASDVWSWGCIFSLVMTYLEGGHAAVQEFRMERQKQEHRDAFYVMKSNNTAQISPTIISWFNHLRYQARVNRNGREFELVRQTLDFLERRVLLPNHTQRATAKEVETCLSRLSHLYYEQPSEEPRAKGVRASIARWKNRIPLSSSAISSVRSQDVPVDMASGIRASLFSPDGKLLALYSPQSIKAIPTNQIMQSITRQTAVPDLVTISEPKGSWECVAVSSRYICGGLAGDCFDCYVYPVQSIMALYAPGSSSPIEGKRIYQQHLGPIKKVVMSEDGTLTAFLIKRKDSDTMVYLAYTPDLIDEPSDKGSSPPPSRSNSAISHGDSEHALPGGNMIAQDYKVGPMKDIRYVGFSSDSQYLVVVSMPDESHLLVRAWDTQQGSLCGNLRVRLQASAASSEKLFTACALFHGQPRLVILCHRRYLLYVTSWTWNGVLHTLPGDFSNMFHVFVREDNEHLIFLGDSGDDRLLRIYQMRIAAGPPAPHKIAMTTFGSYKPHLDTASLIKNDKGEREMLIGTARGAFLAINLPQDTSG